MSTLFVRRLFQPRSVVTDNVVFQLHYKVTTPLLIAFGIIILFFQYLGEPIDCTSFDDMSRRVLNSYCWLHSTYSIKEAWHKKVGEEIPYPGIDKYRLGDEKIYNNYYHWFAYAFLLQAFSFYLPHYIWKRLESRKINSMMADLKTSMYLSENRPAKENLLSQYFVSRFNRHLCYFLLYTICEVLNGSNVIMQLCLTFARLSPAIGFDRLAIPTYAPWDGSSEFSPLHQAFPRMAKCMFYKYNSDGDVGRYDALCVLSINIIAEKMHLFLLVWFIILTILSFIAVLYRTVLLLSSTFRDTVLLVRARMPQEEDIQTILNKSNVGDWFMLDLMCTNLDSVSFQNVIHESAYSLGSNKIMDI